MSSDAPHEFFSREDFKKMFLEAIDERQELIGFSTRTPEDREEHKADMRFLRSQRAAMEGLAKKIGMTILYLIGAGLLALAGLGAKKTGLF